MKKICINLIINITLLSLSALCGYANEPEDTGKGLGRYLWGYEICPDIRSELKNASLERMSENTKSEVDELLLQKWSALFSKNSRIGNSNISKVSTILLIGYYKVPGGIDLLIDKIDYEYTDEKSVAHYPARDALSKFGEEAIPKIIVAYENGMSGKRASFAFSVLSHILKDDLDAFVEDQRKKMSPEAFRRLIDNAGD